MSPLSQSNSKIVYTETSHHAEGAYYGVSRNWTPGQDKQWEILMRREGKPREGDSWFVSSEWSLVLKGLSETKASMLCFILNSPEDA